MDITWLAASCSPLHVFVAGDSDTCDAGLLQGPGKKWEHYELTANGKPVRQAMHVKAGDVVQVITGADKGKVGKISKVRPRGHVWGRGCISGRAEMSSRQWRAASFVLTLAKHGEGV